jgi:hypothetical protein
LNITGRTTRLTSNWPLAFLHVNTAVWPGPGTAAPKRRITRFSSEELSNQYAAPCGISSP